MGNCKNCLSKFEKGGDIISWSWEYCSKICLQEYREERVQGLLVKYSLTRDQLYELLDEIDSLYMWEKI